MSAGRYFDANFWKAVFLVRLAPTVSVSVAATVADAAVAALGTRLPESSSMSVTTSDGDVSVGDRVQVLRYAPPVDGADPNPLDQGWHGLWTPAHDLAVSGFLQVIAIYLPGNGVTLSNGLSFPPSSLVKLP